MFGQILCLVELWGCAFQILRTFYSTALKRNLESGRSLLKKTVPQWRRATLFLQCRQLDADYNIYIAMSSSARISRAPWSRGLRPRWSRGNLLASRSKVRGFKPGWDRWIFQEVKILITSPPGGTLNWGGLESEISGSLKNLKPEKIGLWANFNRHIHILIPKFEGAQ